VNAPRLGGIRQMRQRQMRQGKETRMAEENNSTDKNGKNGKTTGILERAATGVKADFESIKTDLPAKAKEQVDLLKDPTKTQVFTSIFRH
jgi:hypothetical protein